MKMNILLANCAREEIKNVLLKLPEDWQMKFKRMYSYDNLELPIKDVVKNIPEEKLDWALTQVQNSLKIIKEGEGKSNGKNGK